MVTQRLPDASAANRRRINISATTWKTSLPENPREWDEQKSEECGSGASAGMAQATQIGNE